MASMAYTDHGLSGVVAFGVLVFDLECMVTLRSLPKFHSILRRTPLLTCTRSIVQRDRDGRSEGLDRWTSKRITTFRGIVAQNELMNILDK